MGRFVRLLFSGAVAGVATLGFVGAVGANLNGLVLVLFAGFWLGLHAFFGFDRVEKDRSPRCEGGLRVQDKGGVKRAPGRGDLAA